jgi:menaquinone-dependent protoporphyrinogen IX oxidase
MNRLVVYYSLTGSTRAVAVPWAKELGANIEDIQCDRYAPSITSFMRAGYDSWRGRIPRIRPLMHSPSNYGHVVVAGPVWAHHPATPIRALLHEFQTQLPQVAFLLTYGGSGAEQSLREMEAIAQRRPIATLALRQNDIKADRTAAQLSAFAARLGKAEAA